MGMTQWRGDGTRAVVWPESFKTGDFMMPPWAN